MPGQIQLIKHLNTILKQVFDSCKMPTTANAQAKE